MSSYVIASTQNLTAGFPVPKNILTYSSFPVSSCLFPLTFLIRNVAFTPQKKASALHKFVKEPTLASFHFKNLSNDQDKPLPSTSRENTDACFPSIFDARWPQINNIMFHSNETTDLNRCLKFLYLHFIFCTPNVTYQGVKKKASQKFQWTHWIF